MKAVLKRIRISPPKMNLIAGLVRRKKASDAMEVLKFTPKKAAGILYKVIKSAAENAENNFSQDKDDLYVKNIVVVKGPTYKRSRPTARGRVQPLNKRTSHVYVELEAKKEKLEKKENTKSTKIKEEVKKEKPNKEEKTTK